MYGSFQRHIMESVAAERERQRVARLSIEHAAHAVAAGVACDQTHLVGASWARDWSCNVCGFKPGKEA